MSVIVDKDKYIYYKKCEESLVGIFDILHNEEFLDYYDKIQQSEDIKNIWDYFIIPIHDLAQTVKSKQGEIK